MSQCASDGVDDLIKLSKMSARLEPCVSIDFDEKTFDEIVSKVKDWAVMHGIVFFLIFFLNKLFKIFYV